jgi:hypothetical protein
MTAQVNLCKHCYFVYHRVLLLPDRLGIREVVNQIALRQMFTVAEFAELQRYTLAFWLQPVNLDNHLHLQVRGVVLECSG